MNPLALTPRRSHNVMWCVLRAHSFQAVGALFMNALILTISCTVIYSFYAVGEEASELFCILAPMLIFVVLGSRISLDLMQKIKLDRWLLLHGVFSKGSVTKHKRLDKGELHHFGKPATRITWRFEDHLGQTTISTMEVIDPQLLRDFAEGVVVDVLFDPTNARRSVLPGLLGVRFKPPYTITDRRPTLIATPPQHLPKDEATMPVQSISLSNIPGRARDGFWTPDLRFKDTSRLTLSPEGIKQLNLNGDEIAAVSWHSPFALQLTAWPLAQDQLELGVTLIQRGYHAGSQGRIRFQVELPQQCVDKNIAVQQLKAPYIDETTWRALWPSLMFYAQTHGEDLHGKLDLS